ncbi:glycosyltransferase [Patescibacteria group bacterium]|nr:glycosyltransferase [Patescibacteria group bacterium]
MNALSVSVVITTKNEEKNIANCLKSVLRQTYFCDKIEIIVVDNNSTDKTKDVVESYKVKSYKAGCKIQFFNKGPERSAQRNFGVLQLSGEYILYLDADMILSPDVIKDCMEQFESYKVKSYKVGNEFDELDKLDNFQLDNSSVPDPTLKTLKLDNLQRCHPELVEGSRSDPTLKLDNFQLDNLAGLYIPEIIMGESFWCKVRRFERSFYDGTVIDCVRFIRKDKFLEVGGFDESMSGPEDWDLDRKIRQAGKTDLIASPIYHNEAEFDLKKYLNKKGYYAKSFGVYVEKWSRLGGSQSKKVKEEIDSEIKKQLGFYYRFIGVFIENGKWKKLIAHPILAAGMYGLRFLAGIRYLTRK